MLKCNDGASQEKLLGLLKKRIAKIDEELDNPSLKDKKQERKCELVIEEKEDQKARFVRKRDRKTIQKREEKAEKSHD